MEEIIKVQYDALERYFITLSQFGYKDYSGVYKILGIMFLIELLNDFSLYVTEADYKYIINKIYNIMGTTCLIDFPKYEVYDDVRHSMTTWLLPRITQDMNFRFTEDVNLRSML